MKHAYAIEVLRRAAEREDKREAYVRELRAAKPNADFFAERAASLRAAIAVLEAVNDDEISCTCDEPSGAHTIDCAAFEIECTCYEMNGGHEPMCPYGRSLQRGAGTETEE